MFTSYSYMFRYTFVFLYLRRPTRWAVTTSRFRPVCPCVRACYERAGGDGILRPASSRNRIVWFGSVFKVMHELVCLRTSKRYKFTLHFTTPTFGNCNIHNTGDGGQLKERVEKHDWWTWLQLLDQVTNYVMTSPGLIAELIADWPSASRSSNTSVLASICHVVDSSNLKHKSRTRANFERNSKRLVRLLRS